MKNHSARGPVGNKTPSSKPSPPFLSAEASSRSSSPTTWSPQKTPSTSRRELDGILEAEKIVGVETGACPHTAIREDPSMNLAAVEELESKFPDSDLIFIESGGDNFTLTFSPALADFFIYVIDVAAGDKIPRKSAWRMPVGHPRDQQGRLARRQGQRPEVMDRDSRKMRDSKPSFLPIVR